jgi:hypothetical protein
LLRAAITRHFKAVVDSLLADQRGRSFVERRLRPFRWIDKSQDSELRALLVIDGDDTVDPMPAYEAALSRLRQDVIDGDIDRGHDLEALQVAISALLRGYNIFRKPLAARIGTNVKDLDKRVAAIIRTWLEAMAKPPAN